jgi:heme A synthase
LELASGLWPYIERAGAVSALLMIIAVVWLVKRLGEEQEKYRAKEIEHLADVKTIIPVIERNTAAMVTQAETAKATLALLAERKT